MAKRKEEKNKQKRQQMSTARSKEDNWVVIEARFEWTTYFEVWFRGQEEMGREALRLIQKEHPEKNFVLVQR